MKIALKILLMFVLFSCHLSDRPYLPTKQLPDNFFFKIEFDFDEKFDSRDSTYIRRYESGDTAVKMFLTTDTLLRIYNSILENKFLLLPNEIPVDKESSFTVPASFDCITIFIGDTNKKSVTLNTGGDPLDKKIHTRFDNVYRLIVSSLRNNDVYKKMRERDFFYQ